MYVCKHVYTCLSKYGERKRKRERDRETERQRESDRASLHEQMHARMCVLMFTYNTYTYKLQGASYSLNRCMWDLGVFVCVCVWRMHPNHDTFGHVSPDPRIRSEDH